MIARKSIALAALALSAAALAGCMTTKKTIFQQQGITVQLISKRSESVELNHPITIAPVRLSHILARIDIRLTAKDSQQRVPAFHIEEIDGISEGLAKGLREAAPNQRVIVYSIRREKRFGIFDTQYLTSFIAYAYGEHLFLHLSRSDWEIPPRRKDSLPEPKIGKFPSKFRILPGKAMRLVDEQALAISWDEEIFERPTRTRVTPSGQMVRKTILMESEEPESEAEGELEQPAGAQTVPAGISAQTLRALADLEERRQRGEIDEYDYERERNKILAADPVTGSN
ncbi:MAG: SHOCT domain-containing protein [Deltaproteobacteria bacterium]|jgi:hypothetical protein|nr:SHOCT domain-containing protein [Deltaproteobacteria bacterium]